jgi:hypothetical protein
MYSIVFYRFRQHTHGAGVQVEEGRAAVSDVFKALSPSAMKFLRLKALGIKTAAILTMAFWRV